MEEQLINAVKNHENLYNRRLLHYRNRVKRAAAWSSISKELKLPEEVCQVRWKSLRDKYVKIVAESQRASGSRAEITESHWQYKEQMEFLREHVKSRRKGANLSFLKNEDHIESSPNSPLDDDRCQGIDSLAETSMFEVNYCTELPTVSTPVNSESNSIPLYSSQKRARRECECEPITDFLKKMTTIAETRFDVQSAPKFRSAHDGFFAMVREIFDDLPKDTVNNAKFFFLNYLHDQMEATKDN